jgi:hypothetical protein
MSTPGLSYSMMQTYLSCAAKYKQIFVDKIKSDLDTSADVSFGTAVHTGLNALLEGEDGEAAYDLYWQCEKNREMKYGAHDWERLHHSGFVFLERFKRLHLKKFQPHTMEQRLYATLPASGIAVEGTPDFVGTYEGIPTVLDFKTSFAPYEKTRILHNPQLYLYAYLAKQALNYEALQVVYMVFVKHPEPRIQVLRTPLTTETLAHMMVSVENAMEYIDASHTSNVWPKNMMSCGGKYPCQFLNKCWPTAEGPAILE